MLKPDIAQRMMIECRALAIWRQREADFPMRCRRMNPDDLDRASGAWDQVLLQAAKELGFELPK